MCRKALHFVALISLLPILAATSALAAEETVIDDWKVSCSSSLYRTPYFVSCELRPASDKSSTGPGPLVEMTWKNWEKTPETVERILQVKLGYRVKANEVARLGTEHTEFRYLTSKRHQNPTWTDKEAQEIAEAFKAGTRGYFKYLDAGGRPQSGNFSLIGFTSAMETGRENITQICKTKMDHAACGY